MQFLHSALILLALGLLGWRMIAPFVIGFFSFAVITVGGYYIFKMVYWVLKFIITHLKRID